jgi:cell wall-associated NlpC family hydrolase
MTTSNAALANMDGNQNPDSNQASAQVTRVTQVTLPPTIVGGTPVRVQNAVSGPVKTSALESGPVVKTESPEVGSVEWLAQEKADRDKIQSDAERKQAELEAEITRLETIARDTKNLNKAVAATKKYVGKTWYAFSGSTPDGWDCSGLVLWMYGQIGHSLEHRASLQKNAGELVENPKIGDIVAFTYKSSKSAYHVGIYVGPDEMIHAGGKRGDRTEIVSVSQWAKGNGNTVVTYTRIIETNN